jgi:integrase
MARKVKSPLASRGTRLAFPVRRKPHAFTALGRGIAIGYRRSQTCSAWVVRVANGHGYWTTNLNGVPDDHADADGSAVLDYFQACEQARTIARSKGANAGTDTSKPASFAAALDAYEKDLAARDGSTVNATRVRGHLPRSLLDKPVVLLTAAELRAWRDDLLAKGLKPASVRRTMSAAKASLNLAASLDARIIDRSAWNVGLSGIKQSHATVSRVVDDATVRAIVNGAYDLDPAFGLFVDVLASTGTRTSQAARLLVGDLQDGTSPRLMLPSSRKGGKGRASVRRPVPITAALARKLEQAAGGRDRAAPLLTRHDGSAWNPNSMELCKLFAQVPAKLGIEQTAYCLRHSSIVRSLLAGTPTRVAAVMHDTSTRQLESVYSFFISDHADAVARRGLLDTSTPTPDESVIPTGRR